MGNRAYFLEVENDEHVLFLQWFAGLEQSKLPKYGIRGFASPNVDFVSKNKKSRTLRAGVFLAALAMRSNDPWVEAVRAFEQHTGKKFSEKPNIWRLEWLKSIEVKLGGREVVNMTYLEEPDSLPEWSPENPLPEKKWVESKLSN